MEHSPSIEGGLVTFVARQEWGAEDPKTAGRYLPLPIRYVLETFTKTEGCYGETECRQRVREIQEQQMSKGYHDIGYNFLIGGDGNVYIGRGWVIEPRKNETFPHLWGLSIEVAHIGMKDKEVPWINQEVFHNLLIYGKHEKLLHEDTRVGLVYEFETKVRKGKVNIDL